MFDTIGRYRIEEERGEGGSSTVFRAFDQDRSRQVALKLLHPHLLGDGSVDVMGELRRSAEGASVLSHRHLTKVLDVGMEEAFYFVCTEYVDGLSTFEVLARHGVFPIPRAIQVVMDVLDALDYAHSQGVIHGDVKPENVMVDQEGRGVLTDFGMFREASEETRIGRIEAAGAVAIPPERIVGHPLDTRSDLYGVGVLLFELVTGTAAFPMGEEEDPREALRRRVEEPPPRIADHLPDCPPQLDEVVRIALARDPQARFQTPEDLARALSGLCGLVAGDIPEPVPLGQLPEVLVRERAETARALAAIAASDAAPAPVASPERSITFQRGAGWTSVMLPTVLVVSVWGLLLFRVGYLSLSTFPPQAQVYALPDEVPVTSPDDVFTHGTDLGPSPLNFRRGFAGSRRLAILWPIPGKAPTVLEVHVPARGHVQVNVGDVGPPSIRTTRVFPTLMELVQGVLGMGGGAPGGASFDAEAPEVDPAADQALREHRLQDALAGYRKLAAANPGKARAAADRLVEAALYNKEHDPAWASQALDAALELAPSHPYGHALLAEIQVATGAGDPLTHLMEAASLLVEVPEERYRKEPRVRFDEVRVALRQRPEDRALRRREAELLVELGRADEAQARLLELARDEGWTTRFR